MSKKSRSEPRSFKGWRRRKSKGRDYWVRDGTQWEEDKQILRTRSHYWLGQHTTGVGPFNSFAEAEAAWVIMYG